MQRDVNLTRAVTRKIDRVICEFLKFDMGHRA